MVKQIENLNLVFVQKNLCINPLVDLFSGKSNDLPLYVIDLFLEPFDEILEPRGEIGPSFFIVLPDIDCRVICGTVAVVVILEREQTPEIVSALVKRERGERPRGSSVAVRKRMNGRQFLMNDARGNNRINIFLRALLQ